MASKLKRPRKVLRGPPLKPMEAIAKILRGVSYQLNSRASEIWEIWLLSNTSESAYEMAREARAGALRDVALILDGLATQMEQT